MAVVDEDQQILSRLFITGPIHNNTPLCVLLEIADAHGLKYDMKDSMKPSFISHLVDGITRNEPLGIKNISDDMGTLQHIARFVNKHHAWPYSKLMQAYDFLTQFFNDSTAVDPLTYIPENFVIGLQTPTEPLSINACVLYQICNYHRLNVNGHTTIGQMAQAIILLRGDMESVLRRAKLFIERDAKRVDLINILMLTSNEIVDPMITTIVVDERPINYYSKQIHNTSHEVLNTLHQSLNDIRSLQSRVEPTTESGAIALAAINYSLDLSYAVSPLREYKLLKLSGKDHYEPADAWLKYWFQHNMKLFDLQLTFNPIYPQGFYSSEQLTFMAENEGYSARDLAQSDAVELLQLAQLSPTFYEGPLPNLEMLETPIDLNDVDGVVYGELLSFGCLNGVTKPVTITELISLFDRANAFASPYFGELQFPALAINKLKILLRGVTHYRKNTTMSEETIRLRGQLLQIIERIEFHLANNDGPTTQLSTYYRNASSITKLTMTTCLTELMKLGMYMRGWNGHSTATYPVKKAPAPPEKQGEIAVNVTEAIRRYESAITSLGNIGTHINNLPLVRYKDGRFQINTDSTDGLTVGARINIVKAGDMSSNIASCIRLSSNWLCASAYKYLTLLGINQPFDIFHLSYVS
jgi:hypothetical protein